MTTRIAKVYELQQNPPTREDGDEQGKVLWFHHQFGWQPGDYRFPIYTDCTHWSHLPCAPMAIDPQVAIKNGFKAWLSTFPTEFPAAAQALMELGFKAGVGFARKSIEKI